MPKRIGIVTDSTADIPKGYIERYGIEVVPLKVFFGEEEFRDGVDLTSEEFYNKLQTSPYHPRTSQPSPSDFINTYRKLGKEVDTIVSIHISGKLSGTYQSALIAKSNLEELDINVIDSKVTSMVLGIVVIQAARAVEQGKGKNEVIDLIHGILSKMKIYFVVDTLDYLQKGGRIGKAAAFMGNLLNIKPLLSLGDGEVIPVEKVRGKSKAVKKLLEKMRENIKPTKPVRVSVLGARADKEMEKLSKEIQEQFNVIEIIKASIGAVIGTYVGPGTVGVAFYQE